MDGPGPELPLGFEDLTALAAATVDLDGRILEANRGLANVATSEPEDLQGTRLAELMAVPAELPAGPPAHGEERDLGRVHLGDADGEARTMAARMVQRGDGWLFVAEPDLDEERDAREEVIELNQELTRTSRELKRELERCRRLEDRLQDARDEAEEMSRRKSAFVANTAHEIRTPMNALVGAVELLEKRDLPPDARRGLATIRSSSDHVLELVNDLMDLSQAEAGEMGIEEETADLRTVVEEALELAAGREEARGLDIAYRWDPEAPEAAVGDPGRLRQVLVNLLSNAVKFTDDGQVVVEANGATLEGERGIRLDVRDTGVGIPAEEREGIFEPFERASTGAGREGTGLGLAIVREMVEAMGGTVDLESEVGGGTRVTIAIPAPEPHDPPDPAVTPPEVRGPLRVADEHPATRELVTSLLEGWGFDVAAGGAEVLDGADEPDLVVVDRARVEEARDRLEDLVAADVDILGLVPPGPREEMPEDAPVDSWLRLPVTRSSLAEGIRGARGEAEGADGEEGPPLAGWRILLVEDDDPSREVGRRLLASVGAEVDAVASGSEALEAASKKHGAVLMDLHLGDADGAEVARRIRDKLGEEPVILAVTGDTSREARERAREAGMDGVLAKPLDVDTLPETLVQERGDDTS